MVAVKKLTRVFLYGNTEIPDPNPSAKPEQCLALLTPAYPALANGAVESGVIENGRVVHRIKVQAGTKG